MYHGNIRQSDIESINTRVVRKDFKLPTFDDLETGDVPHVCYRNAEGILFVKTSLPLSLKSDIIRLKKTLTFPKER